MKENGEGFFDNYHDRGMKKWAGFYLSEHTAIMEKLKLKESQFVSQKEQLSPEVISHLLETAMRKNLPVAIQKEEINQDGHYGEDLVGKVLGHDDLGIYLAGQKVHYDEIRHVDFHDFQKWSDTIK